MKKSERIAMQKAINETVEVARANALTDYAAMHGMHGWCQLRSCQAHVITTPNYYILQSYNTFVAVINRSTGACYDFLRTVYGYTATSAQHIAKFRSDYSDWYAKTYRAYPV